MKKPAKNNMYLDAKHADLAAYDDAIEGDVDAAISIVGFGPLPERVHAALFAACESVGRGVPSVVDASLLPAPSDALAVIEGLDPLALIVADEIAAALVGEAYHAPVALNAAGRLLGRPCVAIASFEADLADARLKQRDWALLKTLR